MTDLIERLQKEAKENPSFSVDSGLLYEAAAYIDELENRIEYDARIMKAHQIRPQGKSWSADMYAMQARINQLESTLAESVSLVADQHARIEELESDIKGCVRLIAAQETQLNE
jgi:predicted  nucleic acid-binding Zn-ribbon protein